MYSERAFRLTNTIVTVVPFVNSAVGRVRMATAPVGPRNETRSDEGSILQEKGAATELAPRAMRADALKNHEKILRAAEETFASEGVAVPIDVVAQRAGVGVGTLYRHFPTKEALFEAIVVSRLQKIQAALDSHTNDPDPGDAFFSFMREFAQQVNEKRDLFDALTLAGIDIKAQYADQLAVIMEQTDRLRQQAVLRDEIRADASTEDVVNLIMGTCHAAGQSGDDESGIFHLIDIIIAGLRPTA